MNTSTIRLVEVDEDSDPHHLTGFIEVYKAAYAQPPYYETYTDDVVAHDVWEPHLRDGCIVLALDGDQVVGLGCAMPMDKWTHDPEFQDFVRLNLRQWPDAPANICFMSEVAVLPSHWRRGIGENLIRGRFAWAKRKGMPYYVMRTASDGSNSIGIYLRLGGKVMDVVVQNVATHAAAVGSKSTERIYICGTTDLPPSGL